MSELTIAPKVSCDISSASWMRAMFATGIRLKAEPGEENVYDFSRGNPNAAPAKFFQMRPEKCPRLAESVPFVGERA